MENDQSYASFLKGVLSDLAGTAADVLPRILVALGLLLLGWVVARLLQVALRATLSRLRFDVAFERIGIGEALGGAKTPPSRWIPRAVYYVVVILFVRIAAEAVGLHQIAEAINVLISYLPNLAAAAIIVVVGNFVARSLGRIVARTATDSGVEFSQGLGRAITVLVFFLVVILALAQLKIDMRIVNGVIFVAAATLGLTFALSVGLGTREITRNIVAGFYARKAIHVGDEVEIDGVTGTVKAVTPVLTLLDHKKRTIVLANSALLRRTVKR